MATVTGAMATVERLLNAQLETYKDKAKTPWSYDRPRNFAALSMFLQNRDSRYEVSAGTDIVTLFNPEIETYGGPKRPGAAHRTGTGGELYQMRTALTEYEWGKTITWHELMLNSGSPDTPDGSKKIWDIAEKTNQDFIVGMMKKLEADLFATPTAAMFGGDPTGAYPVKSLWTGVNVWTTAHGVAGDGLFPGITTQQGLNPTEAKFARRDGLGGATQLSATKLSYAAAGDASLVNGHLIERFGEMLDLLQWDGVPMAGEFADGLSVRPRVVMCSREAVSLFKRTCRAHGELFAVIAPIGDPSQASAQFAGIPMLAQDSIRNAAIYPDVQRTTGLDVAGAVDLPPVDEFSNEGAAGGYYYFFDPESVNLYLHKDRAFEVGQWKNLDQLNEDAYRRLAKMVGNVHFSRFVTNGVLHPAANISGYAKIG